MGKPWRDMTLDERFAVVHPPKTPPPAPSEVSLPIRAGVVDHDEIDRQIRKGRAMAAIEAAMVAEAASKPKPADLSAGTILTR